MKKISKNTIIRYLKYLHERGESNDVIVKKLRSVDKFLSWARARVYIKEELYKQMKQEIADFLKLKSVEISQSQLKSEETQSKTAEHRGQETQTTKDPTKETISCLCWTLFLIRLHLQQHCLCC